jgi:uncharacterized protein
LYSTLRKWADENGFHRLLSGTNLDDLGDYRPGLQAALEFQVFAPLAQLQVNKTQVRELANYFELAVADKPASPCLASRIAYGQSVTPERLKSIEQAEQFLNSVGFQDVRVRLHADGLVRLELNLGDLSKACEAAMRERIQTKMREIGFKYVTLDLGGRQSGSMNRVLPVLRNI